jgi:hypothetical protein
MTKTNTPPLPRAAEVFLFPVFGADLLRCPRDARGNAPAAFLIPFMHRARGVAQSNFRIPTGWRTLRVADPRSGARLCEAQQAEPFSDPEITFGNQFQGLNGRRQL